MRSRKFALPLTLLALASAAATFSSTAQALPNQDGRANVSRLGSGSAQAEQSGSSASANLARQAPRQEKQITGYHLSPEKYAQAVAYSRARYRLEFIDTFYGLLVLLLVLRWRWAPRFRNWALGGGSRPRVLQVLIFAPLLVLTLSILGLPTSIYGHWLSRNYQQSVQGWGSWAGDWAKEQAVGLVIGTFLVWILYGVIRRSPRRWWLYFWLVALPIIVFLVFIEPVSVDPLFFKFVPLQSTQPALASEISKVVKRAGMNIPPGRMFEMKASQKLNSVNAYVTGVGASKRVVVWDTTISKMTVPETLSVFGHEMGHYVLGHIWKGMAFAAAVLFLFLYLGFRLTQWSLSRWGVPWEIRGVDDWASLPVLLFFLSVFVFVGSPALNGFSRYQEHQADVYGLEVIHGLVPDWRQVTAQSFQVMGEIDLADPHPSPFVKFWLYSHPPLEERIDFALHYDPWGKGESPQFVK